MEIKVSSLMKLESVNDYKVSFGRLNKEGENPLEDFARDGGAWKNFKLWKGDRNDYPRRYVFVLMKYPKKEAWLFGGIFEVLKHHSERTQTRDAYDLKPVDDYKEYIGRLLITYPGPGTQGTAFNLENYFGDFVVSEIFDRPYTGEAFCGYENIAHPFRDLENIFKQQKQDWQSALKNVKGVYLIVDKKEGKKYVGSAYGASGLWDRWANYMETGHGGNAELTKLITEQGLDYARNHFQFSILEYRAMKTDDKVIIDRENYWKQALLSRDFGYNSN